MDNERNKQIEDKITGILEDLEEVTWKSVKSVLLDKGFINNTEINEAKDIFDNVSKVKLNYSVSKGVTNIKERTKQLDDLVKKLQLDCSQNIVQLTYENAKNINNEISNDDNYIPFALIIFKYFGRRKIKKNKNKCLLALIREIDRDNSTNVWRYNNNRDSLKKMVSYISDKNTKFFKCLKKGDPDLPDLLCKGNSGIKSLSSKVCKALGDYFYGEKADKYYKNDRFIRKALPFYLDFYGVKHEIKSGRNVDGFTYKELHEYLDKLRDAAAYRHGKKISRNDLDHIIWYSYKSYIG